MTSQDLIKRLDEALAAFLTAQHAHSDTNAAIAFDRLSRYWAEIPDQVRKDPSLADKTLITGLVKICTSLGQWRDRKGIPDLFRKLLKKRRHLVPTALYATEWVLAEGNAHQRYHAFELAQDLGRAFPQIIDHKLILGATRAALASFFEDEHAPPPLPNHGSEVLKTLLGLKPEFDRFARIAIRGAELTAQEKFNEAGLQATKDLRIIISDAIDPEGRPRFQAYAPRPGLLS